MNSFIHRLLIFPSTKKCGALASPPHSKSLDRTSSSRRAVIHASRTANSAAPSQSFAAHFTHSAISCANFFAIYLLDSSFHLSLMWGNVPKYLLIYLTFWRRIYAPPFADLFWWCGFWAAVCWSNYAYIEESNSFCKHEVRGSQIHHVVGLRCYRTHHYYWARI